MPANARILHALSNRLAAHSRVVVGQVEGIARCFYCDWVSRIQAEEPYAWLPLCAHICPNVDLRKRREIRHWWYQTWPDRAHTKRHYTDPGAALECVDCQRWRDIPPQRFRVHRPVHKQQSMPL